MNTLTAQSTKCGNFVFTKKWELPIGGPGSREPFEAPVNLGTWEPDNIGILSSYEAKAVSEVLVPPPLQNQLKLCERLGSIRIKYKIVLIIQN